MKSGDSSGRPEVSSRTSTSASRPPTSQLSKENVGKRPKLELEETGKRLELEEDSAHDTSDCPCTPETVTGDTAASIPLRDKGAPGSGYPCPRHKVVHTAYEYCNRFRPDGKRTRRRKSRRGLKKVDEETRRGQENLIIPPVQAMVAHARRVNPLKIPAKAPPGNAPVTDNDSGTWSEPTEEASAKLEVPATSGNNTTKSPERPKGKWNISEKGWKMPTFNGKHAYRHQFELWIEKWRDFAREKRLTGK